jgi:hypothetical protein
VARGRHRAHVKREEEKGTCEARKRRENKASLGLTMLSENLRNTRNA